MKKIFYLLSVGLLVFTTISCEIGLGAQVDTTRPKIEITYPPKGSVIKGSFVLAGKVSDDVGVTSMKVTLTHKSLKNITLPVYSMENNTVTVKTPAKTWRTGTTWQAEIGKKDPAKAEYNGWDLPDGDYFVDVTVSDGYGFVSDRRSITIDNTAPVFIAENLKTKGCSSEKPEVFGQKINLTGKVKDDNDISKVNFTAYDEVQTLLLTSSVDYSMTSDGIILAQYYESEPDKDIYPSEWALGQNFNSIYGRSYGDPTPTEVKDRYFKVGLEDSAREFKNPIFDYDKYNKEYSITDDSTQAYGTGTGNISEEIYLKTQDFNQQGITIDELNEYKKGDPDAAGLKTVLSTLASSSIALSTDDAVFGEMAKLTINPDINPKWYVTGYEYDTDKKEYNSAYIGAPLTVVFKKGNGTEKFRPSNIRVVLAKLKESVPDSQIFDTVIASDDDLKNLSSSTANVIILNDYGKLTSDLTDKKQVTFTLDDSNLQTPNRYQIMVFGHDGSGENGMSFEPMDTDKYGFRASKNAQPPAVLFLASQDGKDKDGKALPKADSLIGPKDTSIPFYFTVTTDGEELEGKPKVTVKANDKNLIADGYYTVDDSDNSALTYVTFEEEGKSKKKYTFKWALTKAAGKTLAEDAEYPFAITVSPVDKAGSSVDALFNLVMDNKNPEITIDQASPYIAYTGTEENVVSTVNGIFKIPLSFTDDHGTETTAKIYVNGTKISEPSEGTVAIDTISFDKSVITVKAEVLDKQGNTGVLENKYYVDQETDKPVFTFTNLKSGADAGNNFGLNSNNTFSGSVSDDDGIDKVWVRVKPKDGTYGTDKEVPVNNTQINYNFKDGNLITADGKYTVQFKVKDTGGKPNGTVESDEFDILVDGTAPTFADAVEVKASEKTAASFSTVDKNGTSYYIKKDNKVKVTVTPIDENLKSVKVQDSELTLTDGKVTYEWTPASDEASGEKEIKFVAEDEIGNTKEKIVTLFYDAELPAVSDVTASPTVLKDGVNYYNGKVTFKGNISDNNYVKSVVLTLKDKNNKTEVSSDFGSVSSFSWTVDTNEFADGDLTLTVKVLDRAGNQNAASSYTYKIDQATDKPVITIDGETDTTKTYGINRDNLITGTVTDDDGMDVLTITVVDASGNQVAGTNVYTTVSGKTSFSCNLNKDLGLTKSGNYKLKFVAKDNTAKTGLATAKVSEKTIDIEVDGLAPIINNIKVGDTVYYYNDSSDSLKNVNLNETFINGTKDITFTVEELHLKYVKIGTTYYGTKPEGETGTQKALPAPIGIVYTIKHSFSTSTEGANKVSILAVDNSGDQDQKDLVIKYDNTKPTIPDPTVSPKTKDGSVNGIINISGIVSDNDKVNDDQITVTLLKAGSTPVAIDGDGKIGTLAITNQRYTITGLDTSKITGSANGYYKGNLTLTVTAKDRAGNAADTKTYTIPVDQSKDAPEITPVGFAENVAAADVVEGTNLYSLGGTLKVNITDDDGFADGYKPTVKYQKTGASTWTTVSSSALTFANNVLEWTLPSGAANEGKYQIQIIVQDKLHETNYYSNNKDADSKLINSPFTTWIGLTAGTPVLSITTADSVYVQNSKEVTVKGTFQGGATTGFSRKVSGTNVTNGSGTLTQPTKDFTTKDFTDTVKASCTAGTNQTVTVTYTAENAFGQKDEKSYIYYLDNTKPVFSSFTVDGEAQDDNKWYNSKSFDLKGAWTDTGSGVASISYWINPSDDSDPATGTFTLEQGTSGVTFEQTIAGFNEGSNTLWIVPVDGAGNTGDKKIYTLKADVSAPAMTGVILKESADGNTLTVDNYIKGSTLNDGGVAICGNIKDTVSGLASENCITVYEINGKVETEIGSLNKDSKDASTNKSLIGSDGNFALSIPGEKFLKTDGKYNLKHNLRVVGKDEVGNEVTGNLVLFVDSDAPVVSNLSVSKLIDDKYVNGDITIKGNVSDNEDTVTSTTVTVSGNGKKYIQDLSEDLKAPFVSAGTNSLTQFAFTLDTTDTKFTDEKEYTVTVVSEDRVGNTTSSGNTTKFTIKQSTDNPTVTFSNLNAAATDYKTNLFGDTKWDVIGTAYDDDGVAKVEVFKGSTKIAEKTWAAADQKTQVDFTITLPSDKVALGDNDLKFVVTDNSKGNTSSEAAVKIAVDNSRPTFDSYEFYMHNGTAYETTPAQWTDPMFATQKHKIKFTVSDDTGFDTSKAVVEYYNGSSWETTNIVLDEAASTEKTKVYVHTKDAGGNQTEWENKYRVTDKYGRVNELSVKYNVDTAAPVLGTFAVSNGESTGWIRKDNVTVTAGTDAVKDANLSKTVTYAVTGTASTSGSFDVEVDETTTPHQLKNDFSNSFALGDGTFSVTYTFSDAAGNKATKSITDIKVDNTAPEYKSLKLKDNDGNELNSGAINSSKIKVGFEAKDVTSGLKKAYIGRNSGFATADALATITFSGEKNSFVEKTSDAFDVSAWGAGTHSVYLRLEDVAGNVSSPDIVAGSFLLDTEAPVVTIDDITGLDQDSDESGVQVNGTITITGKATDEHWATGTKPVLKIDDAAAASGVVTSSAFDTSTSVWSLTIDTMKISEEIARNKKLTVEFTDQAGNTGSSEVTLDVDQYTACPIIVFDEVNPDPATAIPLRSTVISGTVKNNNGVKEMYYIIGDDKFSFGTDGGTSWTKLTAEQLNTTSGQWSISSSRTDGNYTLYLKVVDNQTTAKTFFTGNTENLGRIRLRKGAGTIQYDPVKFSLDMQEPEFNAEKPVEISFDNETSWKNLEKGVYYGGPNMSAAKIRVNATDTITKSENLEYSLTLSIKKNPITNAKGSNTFDIDFSDLHEDTDTFNATTNQYEAKTEQYNGNILLTFLVADETGRPAKKAYNISVDNIGPNNIFNVTPASTQELTGTVVLKGNVSDNEGGVGMKPDSSSTKMYYAIPKFSSGTRPSDPANLPSGTSWIEAGTDLVRTSINSWTLTLKNLATAGAQINPDYAGYTTNRDGIYELPVWFKLIDEIGNVGYNTETKILYNPNADRPTIKVTYPLPKDGYDYVTLGGKISITGTVYDIEGISAVYIQYDINGDGYFNDTDKGWLSDNGYTVENIPTLTNTWGVKVTNTNTTWRGSFDAATLSTWLASRNPAISLEKGNPAGNERTLNFRVIAIDNDSTNKLASIWTETQHISVNNSVPSFSEFKLVQRTGTAKTGTVIQELAYTENMNISGYNWYLEGTVQDNDGISSIQYTSQASDLNGIAPSTHYSSGTNNEDPVNLQIPVVPDGSTRTSLSLMVTAFDNTDDKYSSDVSFSFNVDNTAPAFKDGENGDTLVAFIDKYNIENNNLANNAVIRNSNGWSTISSKAFDEGSGFSKAVIYLKRNFTKEGTNKGKSALYNLAVARDASNTNRTFIGSGITVGTDGIPVYTVSSGITHTADTAIVTVTAGIDSGNYTSYIRAGSLVRVTEKNSNNVSFVTYRTIASVSGKTVTFTEAISNTITKLEFICGFVVDVERETTGENGDTDGDGIREYMNKSGDNTTWEVSFDSQAIPDGPIEYHVVLFDEVGNIRHSSVSTNISNNAPRLARVTLGTDLNGNGTFETNEELLFQAVDGFEGKTAAELVDMYDDALSAWDLDIYSKGADANWKVKDKLKVKPEFVGGEGPFYYVFSKAVGTGTENNLTIKQVESGSSLADETTNNAGKQGKFEEDGYFEIPKSELGNNGDYDAAKPASGKNTYRFSFWDSAEEATPGVDSNTAVLNVAMVQDLVDGTAPKAVIHPFFWKGKDPAKNSVKWNKGTALGHIELESDLSSTLSTTYGTDPKVSGQIAVRGTAYDENRLNSLTFAFDDIKMTDCVSAYSNGSWSNPSSSDEGWSIVVTDNKITQEGHWVEWTLYVDTSKVTNLVGVDKSVIVTANDGTNSSTPGSVVTAYTTVYATPTQAAAGVFYTAGDSSAGDNARAEDETKLAAVDKSAIPSQFNRVLAAAGQKEAVYEYKFGSTGKYQMDILPYVYKVETELSALKALNPSVYDRTSIGHYPIRAAAKNRTKDKTYTTTGETVTVYGFNISASGKDTFTVGDSSTSGVYDYKVTVETTDYPIVNNINNNEAKGSFTGTLTQSNYGEYAYNRCPNDETNNLLTDDIEFDVWDINDTAVIPVNGVIEGSKMKINPSNRMIQYAGTFGILYAGMGRGDVSIKNVLKNGDTYLNTSIGFHIDDAGNTYSVNYCGQEYDSLNFMSSRWTEGAQIGIDCFNQNGNILKGRFLSPSMATSSDSARVYLAFYDALNDQIHFKAGTFAAGTNNAAASFNQFNNQYTASKTGSITYANSIKYVQVIAGHNAAEAGGSVITDSNGARNAGQYVSIVCVPGKKLNEAGTAETTTDCDVICAVWYDATLNKLLYSYKRDPINNLNSGDVAATGWSPAQVVFENGGEYCQIVADKQGHLHMAAYGGNGDVLYAYLDRYNTAFSTTTGSTTTVNLKTCIVDSFESVGENLTLDVALDSSSRPIPYIGYYNGQKPKYAKLYYASTDTTTKVAPAGVDDENGFYTGNWDITVVPTKSQMKIDMNERINVGVWKNSTGVLINSTKTDGKTGSSTWTRTAGSSSSAEVWGNGSNNGVVSYQVRNGFGTTASCLETAQKR